MHRKKQDSAGVKCSAKLHCRLIYQYNLRVSDPILGYSKTVTVNELLNSLNKY